MEQSQDRRQAKPSPPHPTSAPWARARYGIGIFAATTVLAAAGALWVQSAGTVEAQIVLVGSDARGADPAIACRGPNERAIQAEIDRVTTCSDGDCGDALQKAATIKTLRSALATAERQCDELARRQVLPSVSLGALVTPETYRSAVRDRARLVAQRRRLEAKLRELRYWRGDLARYQAEFEALRIEAAKGALSDILAFVPAEPVAQALSGSATLGPYLSPDFKAKFIAAYDAAKGIVSTGEGVPETNSAAQFKKIAEGQLAIRAALQRGPWAALDPEAERWLTAMDKTFQAAVVVGAGGLQMRDQTHPVDWRQGAQVALEVGGVLNLPLGVTLAGERLAERGTKRWVADKALNEFSETLAKNWNAEYSLQDHVGQKTAFISELDRTIASYRAEHR